MITTEELDQILKELPYAAGGWAAETIRRLVAELKKADVLHRGLLDAGARATAEAAALRVAIGQVLGEQRTYGWYPPEALVDHLKDALSQRGPGSALLERLQKAEREVESLNSDIVYAADKWTKAEQQVETLTKERDKADAQTDQLPYAPNLGRA